MITLHLVDASMRRRQMPCYSKRALVLAVTILSFACQAPAPRTTPQPLEVGPRLVPAPASLRLESAPRFEITRTTGISVDGNNSEAAAIGQTLGAFLRRATGFPLV